MKNKKTQNITMTQRETMITRTTMRRTGSMLRIQTTVRGSRYDIADQVKSELIMITLQKIALPRGSKYPIFKVSCPKDHLEYGFWNQKPEVLGTWTLWVLPIGNLPTSRVQPSMSLLLKSYRNYPTFRPLCCDRPVHVEVYEFY